MNIYARIQDGLVAEKVSMHIATDDILKPDNEGNLVVAVTAGEIIPLAMLYTPEFIGDLVLLPEGSQVGIGDSYVGGVFGPPPAPLPPTAEQVLGVRDSLLATAALRIAPLQDAVDLDEATLAEKASLKAWKQYRVTLNRIEQQAGFPAAVDWPPEPS